VGETVQKGVGKISAGTRQQDESGTEPQTQHARYGAEKKGGGDGVGRRMDKVGMQGESGHRTPGLAKKYPVSIRTAAFEPRHRLVPYNGGGKKYEEHPRNGNSR
jgi:hypothetical protein